MSHNTEMIHNNMDPTITCYCPDIKKLKQSLYNYKHHITVHKCREKTSYNVIM